jgi:hypothetical protein
VALRAPCLRLAGPKGRRAALRVERISTRGYIFNSPPRPATSSGYFPLLLPPATERAKK